jgi:hypothetical protein
MRLTIRQSVSLGVEPHLGLFDSYGLVFSGAPSLTGGRVYLLYLLLAVASAVFLGSESLGTAARRVTVEVGIRPRLHTGSLTSSESFFSARLLI